MLSNKVPISSEGPAIFNDYFDHCKVRCNILYSNRLGSEVGQNSEIYVSNSEIYVSNSEIQGLFKYSNRTYSC